MLEADWPVWCKLKGVVLIACFMKCLSAVLQPHRLHGSLGYTALFCFYYYVICHARSKVGHIAGTTGSE